MIIADQSWPLMVIADRDGNPIEGLSSSSSEHYVLEKILGLAAGEYRVLRPYATVVTEGTAEIAEPEPEPDPVPAPDLSDRPESIRKAVDEAHLLNFDEWNATARYTRAARLMVWREDTATIDFDCQDLTVTGGGGRRELEGSEYTLLIDGDPHSHTLVEPGDRVGQFQVNVAALSPGWHVLDISEHGAETSVPYPVFVKRGDTLPKQEWVPVFTGSHEIHDWFNLSWVPAQHKPLPWPTPKREFPHFDTIPGDNDLFVEMLTGAVTGHARRLNVNKDGILSTATVHDYFWGPYKGLTAKKPRTELLDGPRGENVVSMVTHISVGQARQADEPDSPLLNNVYITTPWSFCRVGPDGYVKTLSGYRHKSPPSYWEDDPDMELVGDWSGIEPERRRHRELWGQCWLQHTLKIDHTAEPIPEEDNRIPHAVGPTAILADPQMDALRSVQFDPASHGVPPKVTEFYRGSDMWDCVSWGEKVIASERGKHRVILLDKHGNLEEVLLQGAALSELNYLRQVRRIGTLEECRAEDIVSPEGLYILPGSDELYIGDSAQEQVRRLNLITREIDIPVPNLTGRLNFVKVAVSDGTTGPRGTVFASLWNVGAPEVHTPDGRKWSLAPFSRSGTDRGRSDGYTDTSYSTAVGCGNGRILAGSAMEGIRQWSMALPDDFIVDRAQYTAGKQEWQDKGYYLSHGDFGESYFGLPLPWGETQAIDYYLAVLGH